MMRKLGDGRWCVCRKRCLIQNNGYICMSLAIPLPEYLLARTLCFEAGVCEISGLRFGLPDPELHFLRK
jgi:hypothetical protein